MGPGVWVSVSVSVLGGMTHFVQIVLVLVTTTVETVGMT